MIATVKEHWWLWLIRGAIAIIFGVIAVAQPGATALALVWTFGVYAVADSILAIVGALGGATDHRIWQGIWGMASILAGLVAFAQPALTGITLVWVIAAWAIITGVLQIVAALRVRQEITGEFWLMLAGALSMVAGVLLFAAPGIGGISLVYLIDLYAVLLGIAFISLVVPGIAQLDDENVLPLRRLGHERGVGRIGRGEAELREEDGGRNEADAAGRTIGEVDGLAVVPLETEGEAAGRARLRRERAAPLPNHPGRCPSILPSAGDHSPVVIATPLFPGDRLVAPVAGTRVLTRAPAPIRIHPHDPVARRRSPPGSDPAPPLHALRGTGVAPQRGGPPRVGRAADGVVR